MTLEWIIRKLETEGKGTKQEVLDRLKNSNKDDLIELVENINKKMEKMSNMNSITKCDEK